MNISLITSGHQPFDDRIFYHMARTLKRHSHRVQIISSKLDLIEVIDEIKFDCFNGDNLSKPDKIIQFAERLSAFLPEIIICSEPLTILASKKYSKKQPKKIRIIYDITEWYPSRKNLTTHKYYLRWFFFIKLLAFNTWVSQFADSFIFGEWYKSKPYRLIYPGKPFIFITYYPDLDYISHCIPSLQKGILRLSYSGKISMEKGFGNFFRVLQALISAEKDLNIEVKIIGWYENSLDKKECEHLLSHGIPKISFSIYDRQPYPRFSDLIKETDIFLDLRSDDFENQHCLPIKLFYYAAQGRPVIYTDLRAIRKEVEIGNFGFLVKPSDTDSIVQIIRSYTGNEKLYLEHCKNARRLAEESYNWQKICLPFLRFVESPL